MRELLLRHPDTTGNNNSDSGSSGNNSSSGSNTSGNGSGNYYLTGAGKASGVYIVKKDDNLTMIARMFGTTVDALVEKKKIKNRDLIYPGQEIRY